MNLDTELIGAEDGKVRIKAKCHVCGKEFTSSRLTKRSTPLGATWGYTRKTHFQSGVRTSASCS